MECEDTKRRERESATRVSELEQELADLQCTVDKREQQYQAETESLQLRADVDRLRQIEGGRQQFDKERDYHRMERERDHSLISQLKAELEAASKARQADLPRPSESLRASESGTVTCGSRFSEEASLVDSGSPRKVTFRESESSAAHNQLVVRTYPKVRRVCG